MHKKKTLSIFQYCLVFTFLLFTYNNLVYSHSGHSHGGSKRKVIGKGKGFLKSGTEVDDSTRLTLDLYGNIGVFLSHRKGFLGGEPLGAGGKGPVFYKCLLFPGNPFAALPPTVEANVEDSDFGYIPLWDPNELSIRLKYRFSRQLYSMIDLGFTEDKGTQEGGASWSASLSQLKLNWTPSMVEGVNISSGHISNTSKYSTIFGQTPLLSSTFQGLTVNYKKEIDSSKSYSLSLSGGASFLDRVFWGGSEQFVMYSFPKKEWDPSVNDSVFVWEEDELSAKGLWGESRLRSYLYGQLSFKLGSILDILFLLGVQSVPEIETQRMKIFEIDKVQKYKKGLGWTIGLETGYTKNDMEHIISLVYGRGDIEMGWGTPDNVFYYWPYDSIIGDQQPWDTEYFSRNESSLISAVYWGNFFKKKFQCDWGLWYTYHKPASNEMKYANIFMQSLPMPDSVVQELFPGVSTLSELPDTFTLNTQPYATVKFALNPSYKLGDLFRFGLRYDHIRHLNPDAHTNTMEQKRNSALEIISPTHEWLDRTNLFVTDTSKWEWEAVNANIFTPSFALEIGDVLTIKAAYPISFFSDEVRRQGEIKKIHSNFTFSTSVFYTFSSSGRDGKALGGKISKEEAETRAREEVVKLIQANKIDRSWINIAPESAEKKKFATNKQWVVHFYNDEIEDDDKCDLYIFLSLEGYFDTYNHFGE